MVVGNEKGGYVSFFIKGVKKILCSKRVCKIYKVDYAVEGEEKPIGLLGQIKSVLESSHTAIEIPIEKGL